MIDLHMHSEFSVDSRDTPEELVARGKERGLVAIALTEHEGIGSAARARHKAQEFGMEYVNGIEISGSVVIDDIRVPIDVLGYFYRDDAPNIRRMLEPVIRRNDLETEAILVGLAAAGVAETREEIEQGCAGRASAFSIGNVLRNLGYSPEQVLPQAIAAAAQKDEAFSELLENKRPTWAPGTNLELGEVIDTYHADGAIAMFAHPFWLTTAARGSFPEEAVWQHIEVALEMGMDGLEVFHHYNRGREDALLRFCRERGLPASGGSDSHGAAKVGSRPVDAAMLQSMHHHREGRDPWA